MIAPPAPEDRTASVEADATSEPDSELGAVFIYGRLRNFKRSAVSALLVNDGGHLVDAPAAARTLVVARAALEACVSPDGHLRLPFPCGPGVRLLSEAAFVRLLRSGRPADTAALRTPYDIEDVARLSGLPVLTCAALGLFDVIGSGMGRFAYADLATARQVAALMGQGVTTVGVARAAWRLAARGLAFGQVRLAAAPWGTEIVQRLGQHVARLDGQFVLVLDEGGRSRGESFALGLACELEGDFAAAERHYDSAIQIERADPVPCFNRGNVLAALGRTAEAMIAFQQAVARDPVFAEAAFNLAALMERVDVERAISIYRDTVAAHPAYAQAIYNLARLLTLLDDFAGALPLWDRFVALAPGDPDVAHARRAAALCRLALRAAPAPTPTTS